MKGKYVGYVAGYDPLHDFLGRIIRDHMDVREPQPAFRAFQLSGSNEVYAYEEKSSGTRVICKFYGPRFTQDLGLAAIVAQQEYDNLNILRGYNLVGSPHHVIRPLGVCPDINCGLAVEYFPGEELAHAIMRAARRGDDVYLLSRLKALAYFLSTQHERTAQRESVDFGIECDYFDTVVRTLLDLGRINKWDAEEFFWLRGLWQECPRMWQDQQVWLHGDVTPGNFLFGVGLRVGAIDLERMRRGDRAFDVGRLVGELQHSFMITTKHKSRAEPFISYFFREYSSHFPDHRAMFDSITARTPFYMGLNHLRVARNDYIPDAYGQRLIRQAKRLLRLS
jgi:Phosphotransferase enzyme family